MCKTVLLSFLLACTVFSACKKETIINLQKVEQEQVSIRGKWKLVAVHNKMTTETVTYPDQLLVSFVEFRDSSRVYAKGAANIGEALYFMSSQGHIEVKEWFNTQIFHNELIATWEARFFNGLKYAAHFFLSNDKKQLSIHAPLHTFDLRLEKIE